MIRRLRRNSYSWIFRWTRAVWTLSSEESEEMRTAFPSFAHLFHDVANPYVTSRMLAQAPAPPPARSHKLVVSIARLTAQKRLDRLVLAFAHLQA